MGFVLFLIVALVAWLLWPRSRHARPSPESAKVLVNNTATAALSGRRRSRRRRNLNQAGNARGRARIAVTSDQLRLEWMGATNESTACAVCGQIGELLFQTARIALCKTCEESLRDSCGGPIGEMQGKLLWFVRLELPHEPPLRGLALALNGKLGEDHEHRSRDADLNMHMTDSGFEEWRVWLRAYHLGLTASWPPELRPDDDEWKTLAHAIRAQDGMRCVVCNEKNAPLHVHHIVPLSEGGTNDPINLVTLCGECHRRQHPPGLFSLSISGDGADRAR